jgi:hypothetical protein
MADERRNACAAAAAGGHAVAAVACLVIVMGCSLKNKDGDDGVTFVPHGAAGIAGRYRAGLSLRQRMLDGNGLML